MDDNDNWRHAIIYRKKNSAKVMSGMDISIATLPKKSSLERKKDKRMKHQVCAVLKAIRNSKQAMKLRKISMTTKRSDRELQ